MGILSNLSIILWRLIFNKSKYELVIIINVFKRSTIMYQIAITLKYWRGIAILQNHLGEVVGVLGILFTYDHMTANYLPLASSTLNLWLMNVNLAYLPTTSHFHILHSTKRMRKQPHQDKLLTSLNNFVRISGLFC